MGSDNRKKRRTIAILVIMAILIALGVHSCKGGGKTEEAEPTSGETTDSAFEKAREQYGLAREMKDGNTLHAWMWSSTTIKENMQAIAEAGWTSIQTEPMQKVKQNTANGMRFYENWWYVYQPVNNDVVGNFVMGTEDEFTAMCEEAHKYGVRVIVDVVANHMTSDWDAIEGRWKNRSWYRCGAESDNDSSSNITNWDDRYEITHKALLGLWEIDTDNSEPAQAMQEFTRRLVADGADGFRFDAAKHIELPGEFPDKDPNGSPYWNYILDNGAQFQYGEILQDKVTSDADYEKLFSSHSSHGGAVTASGYGYTVRAAITSGIMRASDLTDYSDGAPADHVVTWVESHDNYANNNDESRQVAAMSDDQIRLGWVIVGSRAEGMPLYFNRPKDSGGDKPQFAETSQLGDAGDDMWRDPAISAINHLRNQMDGNLEYLRSINGSHTLLIDRYNTNGDSSDDGMAVANSGDDYNLTGIATKLDDGTYPDQVNAGNALVVEKGAIKSGVAKKGVSVFFTPGTSNVHGSVSASPADTSFKTNTLTITLSASNATDLAYETSEGDSGTFTDGQALVVGGSISAGDSVTVTVTGTDTTDGASKGKALKATYTYTKEEAGTQGLASWYSTNVPGMGVKKTISVDGDISDWDESMKIAQGAANDDPRVYRTNSMYEVPIDLYSLYGAWDDDNLYLMWEYTNVSDVVDADDDYPLSQGVLYQTQNLPQWIAVNTGDGSSVIGNGAGLQSGGTLWDNRITFTQQVNRLIAMSTNGANGPWVYAGDSTGTDSWALYGPDASTDAASGRTTTASGIQMAYGSGILESEVHGMNSGSGTDTTGQGDRWGVNGNPQRTVGDMKDDSGPWVEFNSLGHNSQKMDFHYEMKIPLSELGLSSGSIDSTGISVMVIGTMGLSGMDSLPYDLAMNDNADLPDTKSQTNNSYEKSDSDEMSAQFACIGKCPTGNATPASASSSAPAAPASASTPTTAAATSGSVTNRLYATVTWGAAYAYVYSDSADNAAWPGVAMTKADASDPCGQSGWYYDVPANLASGAHVIFSDGGSNRSTPDMAPGMDYSGGAAAWNGDTNNPVLAPLSCS